MTEGYSPQGRVGHGLTLTLSTLQLARSLHRDCSGDSYVIIDANLYFWAETTKVETPARIGRIGRPLLAAAIGIARLRRGAYDTSGMNPPF